MKRFFLLIVLITSCSTGKLEVIADLPSILKEASGTEITRNSDFIWLLNDGGNKPQLFGVDTLGTIKKQLDINAKNTDWEDLTSDKEGNLYIADFGNNASSRKDLSILKIKSSDLKSDSIINVERIEFKYPNQKKFPPKKKQLYFDSEALIHYNDSLYIFTKSRVKSDYGKTNLYKIPAVPGKQTAQYISSYTTCNNMDCWITSADISADAKKIVLLTHKSAWVFTDFKGDNFFNGTATELSFDHESQKEGVCFKDANTLYIADERSHGSGGNMYEFKLN